MKKCSLASASWNNLLFALIKRKSIAKHDYIFVFDAIRHYFFFYSLTRARNLHYFLPLFFLRGTNKLPMQLMCVEIENFLLWKIEIQLISHGKKHTRNESSCENANVKFATENLRIFQRNVSGSGVPCDTYCDGTMRPIAGNEIETGSYFWCACVLTASRTRTSKWDIYCHFYAARKCESLF